MTPGWKHREFGSKQMAMEQHLPGGADGANEFAPQTGMNEFGLAFVTLATATPENGKASPDKKEASCGNNLGLYCIGLNLQHNISFHILLL
jgi:hypothetical protein